MQNKYHRHLRLIGKRIWNNYYLKNWIERVENKKLLKEMRGNPENNVIAKNPLISVQISTYNRSKILTGRSIPSVLRQTYQNFEIVVVGDHCTDDTEKLIKKMNDERIKFFNLPERGAYPKNPIDRWRVAGSVPSNKSLEMCAGQWIAPLDDDDEFSEDHLEVLLNFALENDFELVYGVVEMEKNKGEWIKKGSYPLKSGEICHLSVLYHSKLKFFKHDVHAWKNEEPADWNLWRRMKEAGVRTGFIDKIVGKHYQEGMQRGK